MWFIIIIAIAFIFIGINGASKQKENETQLSQLGYSNDFKIETGKYVAGHPDINDSILQTSIFPKNNKLEIFTNELGKLSVKKADIDFSSIKNIVAEDQSSIEKRVTVDRLLLTGIFAFAWKKNKKNELAYLTIEWNDGKFDHETIFEFEGTDAMQKANTARNKIIKLVR